MSRPASRLVRSLHMRLGQQLAECGALVIGKGDAGSSARTERKLCDHRKDEDCVDDWRPVYTTGRDREAGSPKDQQTEHSTPTRCRCFSRHACEASSQNVLWGSYLSAKAGPRLLSRTCNDALCQHPSMESHFSRRLFVVGEHWAARSR